ncbi:MAG: sulfite exporter TauE/SafE family protein, partial [Actinomycetota bacterium]|nr:sulfite exporter TauE/SafE family protein [Actinomycetota bacterium]
RLLVAAPEAAVAVAVIVMIGASLLLEQVTRADISAVSAATLALTAGGTSGFSGTSGPLKGVALRRLRLDRFHLVGAASAVSLVGDATKAAVFVDASLLGPDALAVLVAALPLMPMATFLGRRINQGLGERAYAGLFWGVMAGYTLRLAGALV